MFCPKCGAENPFGSLFCGNCGNKLRSDPTPKKNIKKPIIATCISVIVIVLIVIIINSQIVTPESLKEQLIGKQFWSQPEIVLSNSGFHITSTDKDGNESSYIANKYYGECRSFLVLDGEFVEHSFTSTKINVPETRTIETYEDLQEYISDEGIISINDHSPNEWYGPKGKDEIKWKIMKDSALKFQGKYYEWSKSESEDTWYYADGKLRIGKEHFTEECPITPPEDYHYEVEEIFEELEKKDEDDEDDED